MKIKLTELEKKLGYPIKKNFKSIGFDTATKTGVGIITTDNEYANIDWALVHFKSDSIQEVYIQMYKSFGEMITKDLGCCVVENVFVGMNPDTSIKLARFGGLVIAHAIDNKVHFEMIGPTSSRSKLGINTRKYPGKAKKAVRIWLKETLDLELKEDNCADGVVLALLGICEGMDFKPKSKKKKRKVRATSRGSVSRKAAKKAARKKK